ncbi:penicillin-binding protein 1B [Buchnera aphidicola (Diuraphis noxia)]|uniref:Penicillin-binding protein 1B n=1 Tax=Buchnera aphidicola subsp. Diuraphis noxia TaxID=118101 RepID=A0A1B2H897_BUCDN|nr:penicillin-binding protein 1B [Buchnera aphidicola]ANZ22430.1 penicillin-binding protein 1B [Buchnera aphidicola (Diuraphis noxia)]
MSSLGLLLFIFYGLYLYIKISKLIDGKVWSFPTSIYSRIINLEPGSLYSQTEVLQFLNDTMYKKVNTVMLPGEYSIHKNQIEFIRRSFDFPDIKEKEVYTRLCFKNNILTKITNIENNRDFNFFRLEPKLITMLKTPDRKQRIFQSYDKFPKILVKTLLTIEDKNFYKHEGINIYSIGRAFLANLTAGHTIQGGSTLTQQLVKNLFLTNTRSIFRKVNEIYMALILDYFYTKNRILELYLNEVYLGQDGDEQIRGFPLASIYYFGRPIDELTLDQYALLVGMVKGASLYNPWTNPSIAMKRRNLVLSSLYNQKLFTKKIYQDLCKRSLNVQCRGDVVTSHPAFVQLVNTELKKKINYSIEKYSGVKIFTTLDFVSQNAAEKAVKIGMPILKKQKQLKDLEVAMVVIDKFTGEVQALIGGSKVKFNGYNRALHARRAIGSLSKPITYLTALSQPDKYNLNTWISDTPISIKLKNGKYWIPNNNNYHFSGKVMLLDALVNSINIPTVNLSLDIGLNKLIDSWLRLGVSREYLTPYPSISLGAINLTPIEIAQVFQIISNSGFKSSLSSVRSVVTDNNQILYQSLPTSKHIISSEASYLTLYAMQQVIKSGTAKSLGKVFKNINLAGKTGTTNNLVDNWFVGIDGKQVVIIWIGRDNNKTTRLYSSSGAMQIYKKYLQYHNPKNLILNPPKNIDMFYIDSSGKLFCTKSDNHNRFIPIWSKKDKKNCFLKKPIDYFEKFKNKKKSFLFWLKDLFIH